MYYFAKPDLMANVENSLVRTFTIFSKTCYVFTPQFGRLVLRNTLMYFKNVL